MIIILVLVLVVVVVMVMIIVFIRVMFMFLKCMEVPRIIPCPQIPMCHWVGRELPKLFPSADIKPCFQASIMEYDGGDKRRLFKDLG